MSFNLFGASGDWRVALASLFTRYQGQGKPHRAPGMKKYRAKRKIRNKIAKLSRRANR